MAARDRYLEIFGRINTLQDTVSWTTGVSNMLEWLLWDTKSILGISKTAYWKLIVDWCNEPEVRTLSVDEQKRMLGARLDEIVRLSEQPERYSKPIESITTPREGLRRAKYFSEDYLNKEFDIFWSLVSDHYLDAFYGQFLPVSGGGHWSSHGNSGLFTESTGINEMQMDNLAYNATEGLLIANELKHRGTKNRDQILKYSLMFRRLRESGFVANADCFVVLFITGAPHTVDWNLETDREIEYCKSRGKAALCDAENIRVARETQYRTTAWSDLMTFNVAYLAALQSAHQVERKLLEGFNETLGHKKFMQVRDL